MNFNNLFFSCLLFVNALTYCQDFVRVDKQAKINVADNNGVAVADYDNDGDLDIFIVAALKDTGDNTSASRLYRNNNNGTFTDTTLDSGLNNLFPISEEGEPFPGLYGFKYGVAWGDYNSDGYADIFLSNVNKIQLFKNNGNGTFSDVTQEVGILPVNGCNNTGVTWFDYNKDGALDVYICDWGGCDADTMYLNNGDGTFVNIALKKSENSYVAFPFDFNNDLEVDIFLGQDQSFNQLLINDNQNVFIDKAVEFGLVGRVGASGFDMAIAIGDYNNNGDFDFYVTNITNNEFYENKGDNTFENTGPQNRINDAFWAWDATFSDFDLDGDEDLFVVNGFRNSFVDQDQQNNRYFKNLLKEGNGAFVEQSEEVGLFDGRSITVGCTPFDYDNDGDLDLFVTNSDRSSYLYENKIIDASTDSQELKWLKVSLQGTTSNRNAIGAEIMVQTDLDNLHRYYTGLGFLSQSIQPVHFGLGKAATIEKMIVKWPSGMEEEFLNIPLNSSIKITENQGLQVLNVLPAEKKEGCTDPLSCNFDIEVAIDNGSCTYLTNNVVQGGSIAQIFETSNYTYISSEESSELEWSVKGGHIESGQGTENVIVRWELGNKGEISVVEVTSNCSSLMVNKKVTLEYNAENNSQSIARLWNEALLNAIRGDLARPTVHARNLFHVSVALYDSWAVYDNTAKTYLLGNTVNGFTANFEGFNFKPESKESNRQKTISYAAYRILKHRFQNAPKAESILENLDFIMETLGYSTLLTSVDYKSGNSAFLGNYIAQVIIDYGLQDNSNEVNNYANISYLPVNESLILNNKETEPLLDPNRWQPLTFNVFIDQSGNQSEGQTPKFVGAEWGKVSSFALSDENKIEEERDNQLFNLFHDPGPPVFLGEDFSEVSNKNYKELFAMVSTWSSHLDPTDNVLWDISPRSKGNNDIRNFPTDFSDFFSFYNESEGGDRGEGRAINPKTNTPYEEQIVPRGDFTRVLAEFWADGPDSETPPGHWFTILNSINESEEIVRKFEGSGEALSELEWDVKSYFLLGGAMHDSAVATWSIKGWYDYLRPISAIRHMAFLGQSSNPNLDNYNKDGIILKENLIEIVEDGDPLEGRKKENVGKIKLFAWKGGKSNIDNDSVLIAAGVDWILAEDWFPYQRPSFVTPPFAGYVSGHSTFSRAAAEVLTMLTGDEYFPGGLGEFIAEKDNFLVFEKGPSVDVKLQWATYRDASDQSGLSRIWGGIHPPTDDLPGRIIGEKVGIDAFNFGKQFFSGKKQESNSSEVVKVFPNPAVNNFKIIGVSNIESLKIYDLGGRIVKVSMQLDEVDKSIKIESSNLPTGIYILEINGVVKKFVKK